MPMIIFGFLRTRRAAKKAQVEYEHSLKIQAEEVELLRQLVHSQKEALERLEAIQRSLESSRKDG